ncbi:MAG: hypothetical protein AAFY91_09820 [Bacteroidota bacterium]
MNPKLSKYTISKCKDLADKSGNKEAFYSLVTDPNFPRASLLIGEEDAFLDYWKKNQEARKVNIQGITDLISKYRNFLFERICLPNDPENHFSSTYNPDLSGRKYKIFPSDTLKNKINQLTFPEMASLAKQHDTFDELQNLLITPIGHDKVAEQLGLGSEYKRFRKVLDAINTPTAPHILKLVDEFEQFLLAAILFPDEIEFIPQH